MENNDIPRCRQCPSGSFEMARVCTSRFMAICHAKECILHPNFPENIIRESAHISKANIASVTFDPLENCPHMETLRAEGLLPWATTIADFTK